MQAANLVVQIAQPVPVSMTNSKLNTRLRSWKNLGIKTSAILICHRTSLKTWRLLRSTANLAKGKNMRIKHYVIGGYIAIALLFSFYLKGCSDTAHQSYAYNLGKAVVWPISMFN